MRAAIARGEDPAAEAEAARKEATFDDLATVYMERHARPNKRSAWQDENTLRRYIPVGWNSRRLSDITRADVARLHAKIGEDHGHYAANRTLALLRTMFNLARVWELFKAENPVQGIKQFREERRARYLNPDELAAVNRALLEEPDWRWRAYFPLALMLGNPQERVAGDALGGYRHGAAYVADSRDEGGQFPSVAAARPGRGNSERASFARQERLGFSWRRRRRTYRRTREGVAASPGARQRGRRADSRLAPYAGELAGRSRIQPAAHWPGAESYTDGNHRSIRTSGARPGAGGAGADRGADGGGPRV